MNNPLQACLVCLSMNVKLYNLNSGNLRCDFQMLTGLNLNVGLPEYLCFECVANIRRFTKFRHKCHRAFNYLLQLLSESPEISQIQLLAVKRIEFGLVSSLACSEVEIISYKEEFTLEPNKVTQKVHKSVQNTHNDISNSETNDKSTIIDNNWEITIDNIQTVKNEVIDKDTSNSEPDDLTDENDEVPLKNLKNLNVISKHISQNIEDINVDNKPEVKIEEEYAYLYPISIREAKAAVQVSLLHQTVRDYNCTVCKRSFKYEKMLTEHLRMHDPHISGSHRCDICKYYYRTEGLLQSHMQEKHMYKYVCKQCNEVNFDRSIAKQHYISSHMNKKETVGTDWLQIRPKWLKEKKPKCKTSVTKPTKKRVKAIDEFLFNRTAISQEEQYRMVQERKLTDNYQKSPYKCEFCFKGFRKEITYKKHMTIHDPAISGKFECDMCKWRGKNMVQMYRHMKISHLYRYSCRLCDYVCYNICQVYSHDRWHNNVTYPCSFCDREFTKESSRSTHVRVHHPSMAICRICGHSFVTELGLKCHMKRSHQNEIIEEPLVVDKSSDLYCAQCEVQFANRAAFDTHLGSSNKHVATNVAMKSLLLKGGGRTRNFDQDVVNYGRITSTNCEVCDKLLPNDVQARKHYTSQHPGVTLPKRYMCDFCGHSTETYENLKTHIRTHTQERPYKCPHCTKTFTQRGSMKRHLDQVHNREKKFICEYCNRGFAQKITMKLHVQTVHFKIPYPLWDKKNRKRRNVPKSGHVPECTEMPPSTVTVQKQTETQGDYNSAYVNSFNGYVGYYDSNGTKL